MNQPTIEHGEALFSSGRIDAAKACFLSILSDNPSDPYALNDLAVIHLTEGDPEGAEACFQRALAARPDYLEALINLSDLLFQAERFADAVPVLEKALGLAPDNDHLRGRLAAAYGCTGREEDRRKVLAGSASAARMRDLIDACWSVINYWELLEDLTVRERLEGAVAGVLSVIDGAGRDPRAYTLIAEDEAAGGLVRLSGLREALYYKQAESTELARLRERERRADRPVLNMDDLAVWKTFRMALFNEIQNEGGCLGDYTQAKKVLRNDGRFRRYDLEDTLQWFRDNLGPCDCHVYRSIPV